MTPTALRELLEKATEGPWSAEMFGALLRDAHNKWDGPPGCEDGIDGFHMPGWEGDPWADGDLIAAARNALPSLLTEVETLREALELLVADVADYPAWQRPCLALDKARAAQFSRSQTAAPFDHTTQRGFAMETKEYFGVIDKSNWGIGAWQTEPDKAQWCDAETGLPCLIVRGPHGSLCGYVGVDESHPLFGKNYDDVPVGADYEHSPHGGLTYADKCRPSTDERKGICHVPSPGEPDHVWWFGFDCAHSGDLSPKYDHYSVFRGESTYRTYAYVRDECTNLAAWLRGLRMAEAFTENT